MKIHWARGGVEGGGGGVTGPWTKPYSEELVFLREYYEVNRRRMGRTRRVERIEEKPDA